MHFSAETSYIICEVVTMSSKVKVDIRITIFYSDGVVVVVYI
jgi:hypothetical protein